MDWAGLSQVNFGLIIKGFKTAGMYDADHFFPPYDQAISYLKKHPSTPIEDVMKVIAPTEYHAAELAAASMNGMGESVDWQAKLISAYHSFALGKAFKKAGEKLEKNMDVDILKIQGMMQNHVNEELSNGLTKLKDIDYESFVPFQKSGWDVIDGIFGGIPASGVLLAMGETGHGKSFWLSKLFKEYLNFHKKKTGGIYTLEMSGEEYAQRSVRMYPDLLKCKDRLYISGNARSIDEVIAEVATKQVDIVGIDFVDWIAEENTEAAYSYVYKKCVEMGRLLGITVVLLAQPNREGVKYRKFLTKFDARYTGMAENSAWQFIALQMGSSLTIDDDKYPTYDDDHYYMINLKQRGGWPKQKGPGAVILENKKSKEMWGGPALKNKLWLPNSSDVAPQQNDKYKNRKGR